MNNIQQYQSQIDNIMDNFNFHKVEKAMRALGWKWGNTANGIPEEYELRAMARQLLITALEEWNGYGDYRTECGGFKVELYEYDCNERNIELFFCIDSWSGEL